MTQQDIVLVTGGSGYIAGWCVARLLNDGWRVRVTVRDLKREGDVRRALATVVPHQEKLTFHGADLGRDEGWAAAVQGCRYLLHIASPLGTEAPRDPQRLIRPARDGALRAIGAAIAAGLERVVMTSSVAAVSQEHRDQIVDETSWTDAAAKGVSAYAQSKTLAERAAWQLIGERGGATTLATINPGLVVGPVMSADYSASVQIVTRFMKGSIPAIPNLGFNYVGVGDVADLHVRAMLSPAAAGERFIAVSDFLWLPEVAAFLRERFGPKAAKVPTRRIPDILVRGVSLFSPAARSVIGYLSCRRVFSAAKAQRMLGWTPCSARDAIAACAESLMAHGLV
jgi:dihydroflavonol-4-reductase